MSQMIQFNGCRRESVRTMTSRILSLSILSICAPNLGNYFKKAIAQFDSHHGGS